MKPNCPKLSALLKTSLENEKGIHFYFLRHGQSIQNTTNSLTGWTDSKLSQNGRRQSISLNKIIQPNISSFTSFHSSDLSRAKETLKLALGFSRGTSLQKRCHETSQLRQLNFGDDQGVPLNTISRQYLKVMHSFDYKAPNGQSWYEARQRAMKYINSIAQQGHHLISTHGGLIGVLLHHLGVKQLVPNCSIICAEFSPEMKDFTKINFMWKFTEEIQQQAFQYPQASQLVINECSL